MSPLDPPPVNPFGERHTPAYYDAELATGRRTFWTVVMVVAVCGVFLTLAVLGVYTVLQQQLQTGEPIEPIRSAEASRAESTSAFASDEVGVSAAEAARIEQLLDRLSQSSQNDDNRSFLQLVDANRFFLRMKQTGFLEALNPLEQFATKNEAYNGVSVPTGLVSYRLRRVLQHPARPETCVVYVSFWSEDDNFLEWRLWLARHENGWRVYDWERLDLGLSEAEQWGIYAKYRHDPRLEDYFDSLEDIAAAAEQFDAGTAVELQGQPPYVVTLERAAQGRCPPELRDYRNLLLGYTWRYCEDEQRAEVFFRAIQLPEATPGAFYGLGTCAWSRGDNVAALEYFDRYEKTVGPSRDVCEGKALLLGNLGRTDEARQYWRRVLRIDPDHESALASLARETQDPQELVRWISRTTAPLQTARSLAATVFYAGNIAALESLRDVAAKAQSESATGRYLDGLIHRFHFEYDQAADDFRAAWQLEPDAEQREFLVTEYLDVMLQAGRLVEGYRNAPDGKQAFEYLASVYENGDFELSDSEYRSLVTAHAEAHPDDPFGIYEHAVLLKRDGRLAEAERAWREAIRQGNEEFAWIDSELAALLLEQQRVEEAYRMKPGQDWFRTLANNCHWSRNGEALRALIKVRRAELPSDPWLDYYEGALAAQKGDHPRAVELFRRGKSAAGDEETRQEYDRQLRDALLQTPDWLQLYQDAPAPEERFVELASLLLRLDPEKLAALIELHRGRRPDDPQLWRYQFEVDMLGADYQTIAARDPRSYLQAVESLPTWQSAALVEQLARAFLRAGRAGDLLTVLTQVDSADTWARPRLLLHVALDHRDEVRKWFAQHAADGYVYWLLVDEDVGLLLQTEPYRDLWNRHAFQLPYYNDSPLLEVFLTEPVPHDLDQLASELGAALGEPVHVAAPKQLQTGAFEAFMVQTSQGRFWLAQSQPPDDRAVWSNAASDSLQDHLSHCRARLQAGTFHSWDSTSAEAACLRAVSRLAGERARVIWRPLLDRVRRVEPHALAELSDVESLDEFLELGEEALVPGNEGPDRQRERRFLSGLAGFAQAYASSAQQDPYELGFLVQAGPLSEELWIQVTQLERTHDGWRATGTLLQNSELTPELRAGFLLELEPYEITAYRLHRNGTLEESRRRDAR